MTAVLCLLATLAAGQSGAATRAHAISLPAAWHLAGAEAADVRLADARLAAAVARLDQANVLWVPNLNLGVDYHRHDGPIQDIVGKVFNANRSAVFAGLAPTMWVNAADAYFLPLASRQLVNARRAERTAVLHDTLLAVSEAYLDVQQARGDLTAAMLVETRVEDLLRRVEILTESVVPRLEAVRLRAERARRRQAVEHARQRRAVASAELARLLRLPPDACIEPVEPPQTLLTLIDGDAPLDALIAQALTARPELAAHQAAVQAALARQAQERYRPLVPSLVVRGTATNPAGTLGAGLFGGGTRDYVGNFNVRNDVNVQLLWELQNFGLGNAAKFRERRAETDGASLELMRMKDRVGADVVKAHAELQAARKRLPEAEQGLKDATESAEANLEGLRQTKGVGATGLALVVRPQEALASVQALALAYQDFYAAITDHDRAQFRLYRALGNPASAACSAPAAAGRND